MQTENGIRQRVFTGYAKCYAKGEVCLKAIRSLTGSVMIVKDVASDSEATPKGESPKAEMKKNG